jgi:hypothetical protein
MATSVRIKTQSTTTLMVGTTEENLVEHTLTLATAGYTTSKGTRTTVWRAECSCGWGRYGIPSRLTADRVGNGHLHAAALEARGL